MKMARRCGPFPATSGGPRRVERSRRRGSCRRSHGAADDAGGSAVGASEDVFCVAQDADLKARCDVSTECLVELRSIRALLELASDKSGDERLRYTKDAESWLRPWSKELWKLWRLTTLCAPEIIPGGRGHQGRRGEGRGRARQGAQGGVGGRSLSLRGSGFEKPTPILQRRDGHWTAGS